MSYQEYAALPGIRWSSLKEMRVSPRQYRHALTAERADSVAMRIGRAVHAYLLEPGSSSIVVYDGTRRGKAWDAFRAQHAERDIITATEHEVAKACADAVRSEPSATQLLRGLRETVVQWTDPETGLECKAKTDVFSRKLAELKTARDLTPQRFAAQVQNLGYHGQLAWYMDGLAANGIIVDPCAAIVAVQSSAPYDVAVYRIGPEVIQQGRLLYQFLLRRLKECQDTGHWPGIAALGEIDLALPAWGDGGGTTASNDAPLTIGGEEVEW